MPTPPLATPIRTTDALSHVVHPDHDIDGFTISAVHVAEYDRETKQPVALHRRRLRTTEDLRRRLQLSCFVFDCDPPSPPEPPSPSPPSPPEVPPQSPPSPPVPPTPPPPPTVPNSPILPPMFDWSVNSRERVLLLMQLNVAAYPRFWEDEYPTGTFKEKSFSASVLSEVRSRLASGAPHAPPFRSGRAESTPRLAFHRSSQTARR